MTCLRVAFLISEMSDGGAQKQSALLINELQNRSDVEVTFIVLRAGGVHENLVDAEHVRVISLRVESNYDPRSVIRLRRVLQENDVQILVSWLHGSDVNSFLATRLLPDVCWLLTERGSSYPNELRYRVRALIGRFAKGIISNSVAGDKYWQGRKVAHARAVVGNILPSSDLGWPTDRELGRIAYVGRLEPQKNVLAVVGAFCVAAQRRKDLKFDVVGDGTQRDEIERIVNDADVSDRVKVWGFRHDAGLFLRRAALVVSLSRNEGLPNVLLEAVSFGTPILASDIPEHRELLGDSYPFYLDTEGKVEDTVQAMERVLAASPAISDQEFARERIAKMSAKQVADEYMDFFMKMTSQ